MIKLGVNIDHIATVRQARKEGIPDILKAAQEVASGGGDSITIHLRQDRRHIQDEDVYRLKNEGPLPLNLEMAAADEIVNIALEVKPVIRIVHPKFGEGLVLAVTGAGRETKAEIEFEVVGTKKVVVAFAGLRPT